MRTNNTMHIRHFHTGYKLHFADNSNSTRKLDIIESEILALFPTLSALQPMNQWMVVISQNIYNIEAGHSAHYAYTIKK